MHIRPQKRLLDRIQPTEYLFCLILPDSFWLFIVVIFSSYLLFRLMLYSYLRSRYENASAMWFAQLNLLRDNQN